MQDLPQIPSELQDNIAGIVPEIARGDVFTYEQVQAYIQQAALTVVQYYNVQKENL